MLLPRDFLPPSNDDPRRLPRPPPRPVPTHVWLTRVAVALAVLAGIPPLLGAFGAAGVAAIYCGALLAWMLYLNLR